jgi:hypothetical protein
VNPVVRRVGSIAFKMMIKQLIRLAMGLLMRR